MGWRGPWGGGHQRAGLPGRRRHSWSWPPRGPSPGRAALCLQMALFPRSSLGCRAVPSAQLWFQQGPGFGGPLSHIKVQPASSCPAGTGPLPGTMTDSCLREDEYHVRLII